MKKISLGTQKGGVGKTTHALNISAGLARLGKRTLLIDTDSQANASKTLLPDYQTIPKEETIWRTLINREPLAIRPTNIPNLDIVPSHILAGDTDMHLATTYGKRSDRIQRALAEVEDNYDHIIFDTPPQKGWLTINAFTASDGVIIPVAPGWFELDSIVSLNESINEIQQEHNPNFSIIGYLFSLSDPTNVSTTVLGIMKENYADKLLKTVIPRNTDLREATFYHQDIFEYNPKCKGAIAYMSLITEIFGYE